MTTPARDERDDADDAARGRFVRAELLTLLLAMPAMAGITLLFASWRDLVQLIAGAPIQIVGGFAAMLWAIVVGAPLLAPRCARSPWLLAPWNLLLFALGAAFACTLNWIVLGSDDAHSFLIKPLVMLLTFGALPALLLGHVAVLLFVADRR